MTLHAVGKIIQIHRYPVKSFAGESLDSCRVEPYGIYGDRFYAFTDETKEGWDSFITGRNISGMLAYKAKLNEQGGGNPEVQIMSPDGRSMVWNEELLGEIQPLTKTKLSMTSYHSQKSDLMAVDTGSILIITDASLRKLEALWGKSLDQRRFRANFIVALDENALDESSWIGKRLAIGSAELQVDENCERCSMIAIDPHTLKQDISLLRTVNEKMNLHFGVYASVRKTGQIAAGDNVYVVD